MDVQFYGADCLVFATKEVRIVVDDNLASLGGKSVVKADDVAVFTGPHPTETPAARMIIDMPGEYELGNVAVQGIAARGHMDEAGTNWATMYQITAGESVYVVTGHIYPELSETQLEALGIVDVLFVPVGGNGYTLDPVGALKLIKAIEPKLVVPTHYADKSLKYEVPQQDLEAALKELGMEVKERVPKLKLKPGELTDVTQLVVLEKS